MTNGKRLVDGKKILKNDGWFHFYIACFYAVINKNEKAMEELVTAEKLGWHPKYLLRINGTVNDSMLTSLKDLPEFINWYKKRNFPYEDFSKY